MGKDLHGADKLRKGIRNSITKKRLGEKCVYCGCNNKLILTVDHIKPLARGGKDVERNKQVTCLPCNFMKGALTHGEYLKYYKSLMNLKDLNKIKLQLGTFKMTFNNNAFPMCEEDIKDNRTQNDVYSEVSD